MMSLPLQDTFPGSGRTEMAENLVPVVLSYEFSPAFGFSGYKHEEPGYKSINLEESSSGISGIFYLSPQKSPIFIFFLNLLDLRNISAGVTMTPKSICSNKIWKKEMPI